MYIAQVNLTTTINPWMDVKKQSTTQTLEDMFTACVIYFKGCWDDPLPLRVSLQ